MMSKVEEVVRKEDIMQAKQDVGKACGAPAMANPDEEPYTSVQHMDQVGESRDPKLTHIVTYGPVLARLDERIFSVTSMEANPLQTMASHEESSAKL